MIDKITIKITDDIEALNNVTEQIKGDKNFFLSAKLMSGFIGNYKNLRLTCKGNSLKIEGSLTKLGYGYNSINADKATTKQFAKLLIKELALKPSLAISSIEVGFNLPVSNNVATYLDIIKDAKGYNKIFIQKGKEITFIQTNKEIRIYDKTQHFYDALSFNRFFPKNLNILRYEVVLKDPQKSLCMDTSFKLAYLLASTTLDKLICIWYKEFQNIINEPILQSNFKAQKPDDIKNHLILKGIDAYGGLTSYLKVISSIDFPQFKNEYRKRVKDSLVLLSKNSNYCIYQDAFHELQQKVRFTAMHYLAQ